VKFECRKATCRYAINRLVNKLEMTGHMTSSKGSVVSKEESTASIAPSPSKSVKELGSIFNIQNNW
jgi:hypothetical protein